MFNKEKNQHPDKTFSNSATLISAGTVVQGDVHSDHDLRIDGSVLGDVKCKAKVVVGPTGVVEGNIKSMQADISGRLIGNLSVKELAQLRTNCSVQGNITAASLQVDAGAVFNGQSQMGTVDTMVALAEGETAHAKAN